MELCEGEKLLQCRMVRGLPKIIRVGIQPHVETSHQSSVIYHITNYVQVLGEHLDLLSEFYL